MVASITQMQVTRTPVAERALAKLPRGLRDAAERKLVMLAEGRLGLTKFKRGSLKDSRGRGLFTSHLDKRTRLLVTDDTNGWLVLDIIDRTDRRYYKYG